MQDRLLRLANEQDVAVYLPILRKYARPCVGFGMQHGEGGGVGASRSGGGADVPADFDWPENRGTPLDFLLQVNLADVTGFEGARSLPKEGLLAFFYDLEEQPWGFDPRDLAGYHVAYFAPGTVLQRVRSHREESWLPETTLTFWPSMSLPSDASREYEPLGAELAAADEDNAATEWYWDLAHALPRAYRPAGVESSHQLCGYSDNVQGDMQLEAELVMNGLYAGNSSGYDDPRAAALLQTCHQWRLLLQLDSEEDVMWGDMGMLYYWIREKDLAARNFADTWMGLQCS